MVVVPVMVPVMVPVVVVVVVVGEPYPRRNLCR
jgi:hypothetical protein